MKISELIAILESSKDKHGDIDVLIYDNGYYSSDFSDDFVSHAYVEPVRNPAVIPWEMVEGSVQWFDTVEMKYPVECELIYDDDTNKKEIALVIGMTCSRP